MTHTPLTKAEREELPARIEAAITTVCSGMAAMSVPANPRDVDLVLADCAKALADLAAAEAERDALRKIAVDCCNATDGMCTMGVSIEFLSHVPKEVALLKANRNMIAAQRDRAESERDAAEALHNSVMVDLAACVCRAEKADGEVRALRADLDAAEAERDEIKTALGVMGATRERVLEVAGSQDALEERIDSMSRERNVALKGWSAAEAARDAAAAQRDRAESELDAERKMRVEAEAAAARAEAESATFSRRLAEALVRNDEDDLGCDRARMEEMRDERDALKAKLADPRRVLIHETEVVATKEEIASLKARLADLSEADEELHTCRALVNATSENLSVDLERMVDDLADANEKAARSEKDSHSWYDLYKDAKAKLAAVVAAYDHVFGDFDHSALSVDARILFDAIAAARGGAS